MNNIKGIIFDYGGTIDTDGNHWGNVLWSAYLREQVPVSVEQFKQAYIFAERQLEIESLIQPEFNFLEVLRVKTDIQTRFLVDNAMWEIDETSRRPIAEHIALDCYYYVKRVLKVNREVLRGLSKKYPLVIVSNFYGNLCEVLKDFQLDFFEAVIESSVVGVRKPNPKIFRFGIEKIAIKPDDVLVVGDSLKNDIEPTMMLGCKTLQIRGLGWDDLGTCDLLSMPCYNTLSTTLYSYFSYDIVAFVF